MKRTAWYVVATLLAGLLLASAAFAGPLEDGLLQATVTGDLESGRALIKKGANVNYSNDGVSLLSMAALMGQADFVKLLADNGADINARGKDGSTLLMTALVAGGPGGTDTALYLIQKGVDVNAADSQGATALLLAAAMGNVDVVKALIAKGANVNAKTDAGLTPLAKAQEADFDPADADRKARQDEIVRLLKAAGAK